VEWGAICVFSAGIPDRDHPSSAWIGWTSGLGSTRWKDRALSQGNAATAKSSELLHSEGLNRPRLRPHLHGSVVSMQHVGGCRVGGIAAVCTN